MAEVKLNVTACFKSNKFTGMYVVVYKITTEDFLTGAKTDTEYKIFSKVKLEIGVNKVEKAYDKDQSKFWIEKGELVK